MSGEIGELVRTVASLFAVIGGLIGVFKFVEDRQKAHAVREADEIREWQKVVIHKILQDIEDDYLPFGTIKTRYVTEASSHPKLNVPRESLSDDVLRRVLIDMVATGVIEQSDDDCYWIATAYEDEEK